MSTKYDNKILQDRESNYGSYQANAQLIQQFKNHARGMTGWHKMSSDKQQSIDMIFTKIGRIITGDSTHQDSWDDIAGYAELISVYLDEATLDSKT